MPRQTVDIPILGLDRRPSERQAAPGLCSVLTNLQPTGPVKAPYWKRAPISDYLRNSGDVEFTHPNKALIIHANWHYKSNGEKRLILILSNGYINIVDPDGITAWQTVHSYQFGADGQDWKADSSVMGDIILVSISKGDTPHGLYYLYRDQVIPYGFPPLPQITMSQNVNAYTQDQIDAGKHTGLRSGWYAYRYGLNVGDETIAITPPIPFHVDNADLNFSEIDFNLVGYSSTASPTNFDFWKELTGGIDVYISDRHDSKREVLLNGLFYNVVFFDSLDRQPSYSGSDNPNEQSYTGKEEELRSYPIYDVGTEGNHSLLAKNTFSYNARLLLGGVSVDFAEPQASLDAAIAEGVGISAITRRTQEEPVQDDPYTVTRVYIVEFTLTSFGGVLPVGNVTVTPVNDVTSSSTNQVDNNNVEVQVWYDEAIEGASNPDIQFTVTAQAMSAMTSGTAVGPLFTFNYPEDNE